MPLLIVLYGCPKQNDGGSGTPSPPPTTGPVTYNRDIAPIVYSQCATCHRPGQSGPFNLLTYADVKKRGPQIADVTRTRFMPPWLPEQGHEEFVGQRILAPDQIAAIQRWVKQGMKEGDAKDIPPAPKWPGEWQLGKPDLVVKMPEPFTLPSSGRDVYRNFVIPLPMTADRTVSAIEFHPGGRSVHHTFIMVDSTTGSRIQDAEEPGPGFGGMDAPKSATSPEGDFLSWQPGKRPSKEPEGMGWTLHKGDDLVLQMHMQITGKPEKVQPSLGIYFTDKPPTQTATRIGLSSIDIDIPAGKKDYHVKDTFKLPVDSLALAVLPHAHYLAKDMKGYAVLPDGTQKMLIHIPNWDFNWQGDYQFATPVFLPKDSVLTMDYTYDNTADNVRNPNRPPRRVKYGQNTSDEMAELHFQLRPSDPNDLRSLKGAFEEKAKRRAIEYYTRLVQQNPKSGRNHTLLGKAYFFEKRQPEALKEFQKAISLDPRDDEAYYLMGVMFRMSNRLEDAGQAFVKAVQVNPQNFQAFGNLGLIYLQLGKVDAAEQMFNRVLAIDPNDQIARESLEDIRKARAGGMGSGGPRAAPP